MGAKAHAQLVNVVSHYPVSAYVVNRLLPFTVTGEGDVEIISATLTQGDGCKVFIDKFYSDIFHFYCTEETAAVAEIVYLLNSGQKFSSSTAVINIVNENDPSDNPTPTSGPTSLFNKSEGG